MPTQAPVSLAFRSSHVALRAAGELIAALSLTVLAACSTPQAPATKAVYDFGLAPSTVGSAPTRAAPAAALLLADVHAPMALNATAVQYRLSYDNEQELRPYALARWSMAPAQLVQQRLKLALNARGPVLAEGQGAPSHSLKIELEEFVHVFERPQSSLGRVSLRATLLNGSQLVDQIRVRSTAVAPTNDAAGGVRALTQATDAAAQQLVTWLDQQKH
jgi:cholesterol transport system auxiliary component